MEARGIFDIGGILTIMAGAILLLFWIVSLFEGFGPEESPIPGIVALKGLFAEFSLVLTLKLLLIFVGTLVLSLGLILLGTLLLKLPNIISTQKAEELEKKVNRLQTIVWRVLQYMKKES